ncbi:helix-turn-helix domain containing protein [Nocardioides sp. CER19]|uniref:TetR/AcrR family transcriptional regulator n=1 Tax=Nocardioides sp. CER19 TaxID=3038538 RepID=UPI00244B5E4F|nr:helix-turn-helix domain containing protein [Nocardioides sp. CER19]MDH2412891.1 helix-turn-helix domain containing protein [Nocardioides sp. CER19]
MEHRPGRPRRADVDAAVRAATVRLVREQGYAGTTLDQIARAAAVAKTTVYRRWDSKAELVLDALVEVLGEPPLPTHGDELRDTVGWLAGRISDPAAHGLLVGLVGEAVGNPSVRTALRHRIRQPFEDRLVAAWDADPTAVDLAFDVVVGSLLHHAALSGGIDPATVDAVTDAALRLLAPAG